jgi:SAM-dependent methyltransferase
MLRSSVDHLLELPSIYKVNQLIGRPTVNRYCQFLAEEVPRGADMSTLDIGCGVGSYRPWFAGPYCGIDINPLYIKTAQNNYTDARFIAMDCGKLSLPDQSFDNAISIATSHHLDDNELRGMVSEALRVTSRDGAFHIIDAILPLDHKSRVKEWFFRRDRGRFPRRLHELHAAISRNATITRQRTLVGPLHDVAYLRVTQRPVVT